MVVAVGLDLRIFFPCPTGSIAAATRLLPKLTDRLRDLKLGHPDSWV
jgi:hypothetical protein